MWCGSWLLSTETWLWSGHVSGLNTSETTLNDSQTSCLRLKCVTIQQLVIVLSVLWISWLKHPKSHDYVSFVTETYGNTNKNVQTYSCMNKLQTEIVFYGAEELHLALGVTGNGTKWAYHIFFIICHYNTNRHLYIQNVFACLGYRKQKKWVQTDY